MSHRLLVFLSVLVLLGGCLASVALADATDVADPTIPDILRNFRFITSHSMVEQSGGLPVYTIDWDVAGKFGLATGYDGLLTPTPLPTATPPLISGHASFVNVNAYIFHAKSAGPTSPIALDLDSILNLSGLKGTFKVPSDIHFSGDDGQGIPIQLEAVTHGPLMHITGGTLPVPTCASCGINMYKVDAFAALAPYADFNMDGVIDGNDLHILMSHIGTRSGATFDAGDADGNGTIDGNDFLVWQRTIGQSTSMSAFSDLSSGATIPEPATIWLVAMTAAFFGALKRKRSLAGN